MSRLTLTEKDHWKSRIENRINKAIEQVQSKDISLMPKIKALAELEAHRFLGTDELHSKIESIRHTRSELEKEQEQLESEMFSIALGKPARANQSYQIKNDFWHMHKTSQTRFEEVLLNHSIIGKEILKLRAEKDALIDTVWLATSNAQIRDLWGRVSTVLGDAATPLQQQILADGGSPPETL